MNKKQNPKQKQRQNIHQKKAAAKTPLRLSEKTLRWISWLLPVAMVAIVGIVLVSYENDLLHRVQELNLFLYTSLFFKQKLVLAGGFLTYLGTYFTQFFYHPALGVAMLCAWWLLMVFVIKKTFNIPTQWTVFLLVPLSLVILINADLGYWIYYLKQHGHFFNVPIATTVAVALAWLYRLLPEKFFLRTIFIIVVVAVGYPLFGFYALFAALLMAVLAWRLDDYKPLRSGIDTAVALVAIAVVPVVYYWTIYNQTNIVNIYNTGLPFFKKDKLYFAYYIPFILLFASLVAMAFFYRKNRDSEVKKTTKWAFSQVVLLAVIVASVWHFWYKDENFHTELSMYRSAVSQQWEDILTTYREHDAAPSRTMWMMKNLALSRLGRQGDEMYRYRNGDTPPNAPFIARMTQCGGRFIYFNYGLVNYCYRWCMEDGVELGWRVEHLIFMLKSSLLNGEMDVAKKYVDLLKKTKYYAEMGEKYEAYIANPKLIEKDPELSVISHLMPPVNDITSDQSLIEIFLINHFAHHYSDDPIFQEQAMLFAMQTKDIKTFWSQFYNYGPSLGRKHMPTHLQEAAYLYGHLEKDVEIGHMPFDKEVIDNYNNFMATAQQFKSLPEPELKKLMYDRFGGTFYYDYFFTRGQHSF
ncbi:MAG: hypothetical protein IKW78_01360 [Prevotella sp.]|nr:hypothetical protein [Prevotella sp.]